MVGVPGNAWDKRFAQRTNQTKKNSKRSNLLAPLGHSGPHLLWSKVGDTLSPATQGAHWSDIVEVLKLANILKFMMLKRKDRQLNNKEDTQSDQPVKGQLGSSLVVVSGQKATITCPLLSSTSSSNKLLPSSSASSSIGVQVKWLKETTALPYDHRHHIQANGSLVISSSQKRLDEGNYFCSLATDRQQMLDDSLKNSAMVTLRVIDPPRVGPYEFPADLQVGMKARAMCAVMQGDAPFRFSWTQDGRRIESELPTPESGALFRTQHFRDYSLLTVDSLTLAHAGNITCMVTNDAAKTSQSALLKVNAPPQWLVEPRDTNVVLHQSARVDCLASGSPKPFTTWKRAIEPPRFAVQSQSHTAHKDKPTRLLCQPEGDRPIRMEWTLLNGTMLPELMLTRDNHRTTVDDDDPNGVFPFEIKEIPSDSLNRESNGIDDNENNLTDGQLKKTSNTNGDGQMVSVLTIHRPGRADSRVYVCKASNDFGWAELKIRLSVKERPDVPDEFSIVNVTESSAEIRWLTGLRPNTFYNIRIAAQNQIGQGDFVAWTRLRTEQSAPESPPMDVTASPTGPNSVKITWKSPKKSNWNGEISGYYIGYRAENSDTDLYKTVENNDENGNGKFESHITNLHRSTVYEAWVQAFNARGTGPRSELVLVRTLADVPPSAPLLRLHSSTIDSITISWSPAAFGSRFSNDLTLYYRPYQPTNEHSTINGGTVLRTLPSQLTPNTWRDISILEPSGRHTVSSLECGRAYEFFATAHNSVGKSEPSTPLVARTRGDAPSPPPRGDLLADMNAHGAMINLLNWKSNECQISHFSMRIRTKPLTGSSQTWSVLAMHHNPRENFILRKLAPNTAYEIEVTAHSSAGSTQVIHHFVTANISSAGETFFNKMGFDSKVSAAYPMPSSSSEISFSDYEILLPVISSLVVVVVIVAVACFLCSRDHHSLFLQSGLHGRQRQPSASSENKVPFQQQEMSILKELVRSGSVTMTDSHADSLMMTGVHHTEEYSCLNGLTGEPTSLTSTDHLNHHHMLDL
ncbi:hypothetical protein BLOT_003303 [Blomia tropicalis]|nr:hypothetical protein BLOT_003303 [Blomia tropicalis]